MISRATIFALLLGLLLAGGLRLWVLGRTDECSAYLAGQPGPVTQIVSLGRRTIEVPCNQWFIRQPTSLQAGCLAELAFVAVFAVSLVRDFGKTMAAQRQRRGQA